MGDQMKVTVPAATPRIPPTMQSQRIAGTPLATTNWVGPPNRKAPPASVATVTRLPSLSDRTNMPNQIPGPPSATIHQSADASRAPAGRVAQRLRGLPIVGHLQASFEGGRMAREVEHFV